MQSFNEKEILRWQFAQAKAEEYKLIPIAIYRILDLFRNPGLQPPENRKPGGPLVRLIDKDPHLGFECGGQMLDTMLQNEAFIMEIFTFAAKTGSHAPIKDSRLPGILKLDQGQVLKIAKEWISEVRDNLK